MHHPISFHIHTSHQSIDPIPFSKLHLIKIIEFPKPEDSSHGSTTNISSRLAGFLQNGENFFRRDLRFDEYFLCFETDIELDNTLFLGEHSGHSSRATPTRHFNRVFVFLHIAIRGNTK